MTAGIVTRNAGPAMSIAVQTPVSAVPMGPAKMPSIRASPALTASPKPRPMMALTTAFATMSTTL